MYWFVNNSEPFKIQGCLVEGGTPQVYISKATLNYPNNYMWCRFDSLSRLKVMVGVWGLTTGHPVYVWKNLHSEKESYKINQDGKARGRVLWKSLDSENLSTWKFTTKLCPSSDPLQREHFQTKALPTYCSKLTFLFLENRILKVICCIICVTYMKCYWSDESSASVYTLNSHKGTR